MTDEPNDLSIEWSPIGKQMKVTLRVFFRGDLIETENVDLANPKRREAFAQKIADNTGVTPEAVESELLAISLKRTEGDKPPAPEPFDDDLAEITQKALEATDPAIVAEAEQMLAAPDLIDRISADIEAAGVAGEEDLRLTLYLIGVSRLLPRPLAGIVQGQSSSGKSYTIERVAAMFPKEAIVHATQMTPQALFHARPGSLSHRWVVAGERSRIDNDDKAEATRALREMLAAGRLSKMMPVKLGGEIQTVTIEQPGPIAFVESTTAARIFEEDANRCILLSTDERRNQTKTILRRLAFHVSGKGSAVAPHLLERHHTLQRLLRRSEVVIPYAEYLASELEQFADRCECRRAFPMILSMIQASALLHQRQRYRNEGGLIVATPADYELTARVLSGPLSRTLGESLSDPTRRFFEKVLEQIDDPTDPLAVPFTASALRQRVHAGRSTVSGFLAELEEKGFVECAETIQSGRGRPARSWRLTGRDPDFVSVLPDPTLLYTTPHDFSA
jgi:DNA primase